MYFSIEKRAPLFWSPEFVVLCVKCIYFFGFFLYPVVRGFVVLDEIVVEEIAGSPFLWFRFRFCFILFRQRLVGRRSAVQLVAPFPGLVGNLKRQVGVLHLEADLPPAQPGEEVLMTTACRAGVWLGDVVPAHGAAGAVLARDEADPAAGAGELAVGAAAGGEGRHDEGCVEAEVVDPAGGEGEARDQRHGLEGGGEEGGCRGLGFVGVGGIVVRVDLDGGGAVGGVVPDELGQVFGRVPVWESVSCVLSCKCVMSGWSWS